MESLREILDEIKKNPLAYSAYDVCMEHGDEDLAYDLALCCYQIQEDRKNNLHWTIRYNRYCFYLKGIRGQLRTDLHEVIAPFV